MTKREKFEKICLLLCKAGRRQRRLPFRIACLMVGASHRSMDRLMVENFGMSGEEVSRSLICGRWPGIQ